MAEYEIVPATWEEFASFYKCQVDPVTVWKFVKGERIIGMGGTYRLNGRLWGFIDMRALNISPRPLIAAVKREVATAGETVLAACDERFPNAERFLKLIGFIPTDEKRLGMRVFECRV